MICTGAMRLRVVIPHADSHGCLWPTPPPQLPEGPENRCAQPERQEDYPGNAPAAYSDTKRQAVAAPGARHAVLLLCGGALLPEVRRAFVQVSEALGAARLTIFVRVPRVSSSAAAAVFVIWLSVMILAESVCVLLPAEALFCFRILRFAKTMSERVCVPPSARGACVFRPPQAASWRPRFRG